MATEQQMEQQVQGTCFVVGAAMTFALVALVVNVDPLPLLPATECRFMVSWIVAVCFMLWFRKSRGLSWFGPPQLRNMLLLKSACSYGFITLWWAALRHAPIGDCIAIIYASPILTSLYSKFLLGEALPTEFPLQVCLVASGSLLIVDPPMLRLEATTSVAHSGNDYSLVFAALVLCSFTPIVTRQTRDCSWIEVEHVNAALASVVLNPLLLFGQYVIYGTLPQIPSAAPMEAGLIILAAFGSFVGIAMETKGYQLAEAGKAGMFRYIEVPFAYLLQSVGAGVPVARRAAWGSLLILLSCAIAAIGQTMRARKKSETDESKQSLLDSVTVDAVTEA